MADPTGLKFPYTQCTAYSLGEDTCLSDEQYEEYSDFEDINTFKGGSAGGAKKHQESECAANEKEIPTESGPTKRERDENQAHSELKSKRHCSEDIPFIVEDNLSTRWIESARVKESSGDNSKYLYPSEGCYEFVTSDGKRLFLPRKKEIALKDLLEDSLPPDRRHIYQLMVEIEKETKSRSGEPGESSDSNTPNEMITTSGEEKSGTASEALWADIYSPRLYVDLVSDESANREVLRWIKAWDKCLKEAGKANKVSSTAAFSDSDNTQTDTLGRPDKRILIIGGPPGSGKTTLSRVITKQAGYRLVEIDATDEGTNVPLKSKLSNALENYTLFGPKIPTPVLVDGLDKVSPGSREVQELLQLILDYATGANSETGGKLTRKRVQTAPIICTVTNTYAPCVSKLRKVSHIVNIRKLSDLIVINRLQDICSWQSMHADYQALSALCDLLGRDMRACINTLQFIKKRTSILDVKTFERISPTMCHKDKFESYIWDACKRVFSREPHSLTSNMDGANKNGFSHVYDEVSTSGDLDRLFLYCFGNYLRVKNIYFGQERVGHSILGVSRLELIGEFIDFYDIVNTQLKAQMNFDFIPYIVSAISSFNLLFAGPPHVIKLEYTNIDLIAKQQEARVRGIISSFRHHREDNLISRSISMNEDILVMELIPYLISVITPELTIRSVDILNGSKNEKLEYLASIMLSTGLQWIQRSNLDTQIGSNYDRKPIKNEATFFLEPAIDAVISTLKTPLCEVSTQPRFRGGAQLRSGPRESPKSANALSRLSSTAKQQISSITRFCSINRCVKSATLESQREKELEFFNPLKLKYGAAMEVDKNTSENPRTAPSEGVDPHSKSKPTERGLSKFLDYFSPTARNSRSHGNSKCDTSKPFVVFKYSEGYTSSVKKHVTMRELLDMKHGFKGI